MSRAVATRCGHPVAFTIALSLVLAWAVTGPLFHFSDTWQLVINTSTTIVTFLMVFLIQNTQNRDSEAVQVKLDELIRAMAGARNAVIDLEELDDADRSRIHAYYIALAEAARRSAGTDAGGVENRRADPYPLAEGESPSSSLRARSRSSADSAGAGG
jgi:low affinity Fe/Cu permease